MRPRTGGERDDPELGRRPKMSRLVRVDDVEDDVGLPPLVHLIEHLNGGAVVKGP